MKIIGIGGGSGAGKSTVVAELVNSAPERYAVIHFDDYQRRRDEPNLPMSHGMINWDHPDIINWDTLIDDIKKLQTGVTISIGTKDRRVNPDYLLHRQTVKRTIEPRPVLIVEGYMTLYNPELVKLLDKSFYLDLDPDTRLQRRGIKPAGGDEYNQNVLLPMHTKYVEPTKQKADVVINVGTKTVEQVAQKILSELG